MIEHVRDKLRQHSPAKPLDVLTKFYALLDNRAAADILNEAE